MTINSTAMINPLSNASPLTNIFTISLVTTNASYIDSQAHLKFRSYFGDYSTVDLEIANNAQLFDLCKLLEEVLAFTLQFPYAAYILISNNRNDKTSMVHTVLELEFFVAEASEYLQLTHDDTPHVGNYQDETFMQRVQSVQPLCCPYDIDDESFTRDDYEVNPWLIPIPGRNSSGNSPRSHGELQGIEVTNNLDRTNKLVVRNRLASLGAAFPYLNEEDLMRDFDRLSRMNEVTDGDLVELIKAGFEGIGKVGSSIKDGVKELYQGHKEHKEKKEEKNKEQEEKNKEEIAKEKIADAIDKVDNELDDAEYKGDKHIKAARSIANSIIKYSEPKGEQVKREVNKKSEELPSANS